MEVKVKKWVRRHRSALILLVAVMVLASLIGAGISAVRRDTFLPGLNGKGYKVCVQDGEIFCTIGRENDNLLMRLSPKGELLSYYRTERDTFAEMFTVRDGSIYAIVTERNNPTIGLKQSLVRFSLDRKRLKPERLAELDTSGHTRWKSIAVSASGTVYLAGYSDDRIRTAEYNDGVFTNAMQDIWTEVADAAVDRILRDDRGNVAWIDMGRSMDSDGRGHLSICLDGTVYPNVTDLAIRSPNRMAAADGALFVSDSVTGSIYRVYADRQPELLCRITAEDSGSSDPQMNLANFSVYRNDAGEFALAEIWSDGSNAKLVGEDWSISSVTAGRNVPMLWWQQFWPPALAAFVLLSLLAVLAEQIFRGRRLAIRLLLCEVSAALVLLILVTVMQFRFYLGTVAAVPQQQLKLMAASMATGLQSDQYMTDRMLSDRVQLLWNELIRSVPEADQNSFRIRIVWKTQFGNQNEYPIGYDARYPRGYLVRDVEDQTYENAVAEAIAAQAKGKAFQSPADGPSVYQCMQYFSQGDREGCVIVRQSVNAKMKALEHLSVQVMLTLAVGPLIFLALLLATRYFLAPLDRIQKALEEFYSCGGGNQIRLRGIPHTELYEIARVFNELSVDTRVQKNELDGINRVYARVVPQSMLKRLGIESVSELKPGKTTEKTEQILVIAAADPDSRGPLEPQTISRIVDTVGKCGGFVVDRSERIDALTALFPTREQAIRCGHTFLKNSVPVVPALLEESVQFGVFGGNNLLYPAAITAGMNRRMEIIARLRSFGVGMIRSGSGGSGLRLLGWDEELNFYEEIGCHDPEWRSVWREAEPYWQQAMEDYRSGSFRLAAQMFAKVLRLMPEDAAARWYLFRCKEQKEDADVSGDFGLLWDWEEPK